MRDRRISIKPIHVIGAFLVAVLALSASFLPAVVPLNQSTGASVHSKNGDTPSWILELQTRNARQAPVTVQNGEPSYWI